jgi:signal transduction histidine kinase
MANSMNAMNEITVPEALKAELEREIRKRREAEQMLERKTLELNLIKEVVDRTNARMKDGIESMSDGFLLVDCELRIRQLNSQFVALFDVDTSAFSAETLDESFPLECGISKIEQVDAKRRAPLPVSIETLFPAQNIELTLYNGKILTWNAAQTSEAGFAVVVHDVTYRRTLETQLLSAQKHESLGTLAGGIAHEINTPVQYVSDNIAFMTDAIQGLIKIINALDGNGSNIALTDEQRNKLSAVKDEVDFDFLSEEAPSAAGQTAEGLRQISRIVLALKTYSHPGSKTFEQVDLNGLIDTALTVARSEWKHVADLSLSCDPGLLPVACRQDELRQAVLNLIVNACHAIKDAEADHQKLGKLQIKTERGQYAGRKGVIISIADSGGGIPQEIAERIFDPFFTTKDPGKGTGQGLSIAWKTVVDLHQGHLSHKPNDIGGTTFRIFLPYGLGQDQMTQPASAA